MATMGGFMAGSIVAKLLLDKTGWNESVKAIKKDEKDLENSTKKLGDKLNELGTKMTKFGMNMTKMVTLPLAAIGAASVKMAMDAVESENLFEVSMGNMAEAARDWSKELSKSLGLNQYETRKTVGVFNVMLKSMGQGEQAAYDMAKGLTQLSVDMASFYDLRPDEAFLKLQAGISGEIEPLKRLGIVINETTVKQWALNNGLIRHGQELTEVQKIQARYNLIMEQTKLAQGDWARTMETSAAVKVKILKNRIQELSTEIGMGLLPLFTKFIDSAEGGVRWFSGLSDSTKSYITQLGLLFASLGPVNLVLGGILKSLKNIRKFGIIGITITLTLIGIGKVKKELDDLNKSIDELAEIHGEKPLTGIRKFLFNLRMLTVESGAAKLYQQRYNEELEKYASVANTAVAPSRDLSWLLGNELPDGAEASKQALAELTVNVSDAKAAFRDLAEAQLDMLAGPEIFEIEPLFKTESLEQGIDLSETALAEFVASAQSSMDDATVSAKKWAESQSRINEQITADIVNGFTAIMDGSQKLGEMFSSIVTTMIADLGKLVIAEIMAAKKSILASQMEAAAKFIASIFKKVPFPLNIALAAGGFALVSKLFSKLLKFKEGGVFKEPTIAEVGHGTEYVLPEKKLISLIKDAVGLPRKGEVFTSAPMLAPAMAGAAAGGGEVYINMSFNTSGLSRRDIDQAAGMLWDAHDREARRRGYRRG